MQIGKVMTSSTQPDLDQILKNDTSARFNQKCLILGSRILLNVLYNTSLPILLPWQHTGFQTSPILKAFCHLWHSILIFANGTSYARSSKHINKFAWVCDLVECFSTWKSLTYWIQISGDWKRVSCHGNRICYSSRCVSCRTISLVSFIGLCCKLAKTALFIYSIQCWVERIMSTATSLNITRKNSIFFCDTPKKPRGKILISSTTLSWIHVHVSRIHQFTSLTVNSQWHKAKECESGHCKKMFEAIAWYCDLYIMY